MLMLVFVKYPSISSAIRAAKDFFHSCYHHKTFETAQGSTFNEEKLPLPSYVDRTRIIGSGAMYSFTGNQSMTNDERRMQVPTCIDVMLSTIGGIYIPNRDLVMPVTDLGIGTKVVVMFDSVDALSMGEQCIDFGWGFHSVKGVPWFLIDKCVEITLDVENKCPIAKSRYTV